MTATAGRIDRIFRDSLAISMPSPETDLVAAGLLDSLSLVTLLVEVEREFGVQIPLDLDIESLRTVARLAELLDGLAPQEGAAA
jgi:acyl carrier protein